MLPPLLLPVHDKCQELPALIDYLRRSEQDAGNYNIHEADVNVTLEPQERNENQKFGYWCRQVRRPPR